LSAAFHQISIFGRFSLTKFWLGSLDFLN